MIGPLLFTQVLAIAISPTISVHFPGAPYFLAGLLLLSSLTLAAYVTRIASRSPQAASNPTTSTGPAD
jgi:DHA1 family tetracycline resistance protein-like MFS transporter